MIWASSIPRSIGSGVYRVALRIPMVAGPDQPGSSQVAACSYPRQACELASLSSTA